jgi:galactokinase
VAGEQGGEAGDLEALRDAFAARFGRAPLVAARAPGRVNLIGEHTDYNDGLVLPCAIDRDTWVVAAPRRDRCLRAFSQGQAEPAELDLDALAPAGGWGDTLGGAAFALEAAGARLPGAELGVASRVPIGAGLSSSAALGVALASALARLAGLALPPRALAEAAHRGEREFVGVPCGILDPFASALGRRDHALRIDCRTREVEAVPLGAGRVALLVVHSGAARALATAGYRERVAECAAALAAARAAGVAPPGASALRDLSAADLPALARALEPTLLRRVRHVVTENERVDRFRDAVAAGDLAGAGALLRESMRSLRDDYAVSTPALDAICAAADALPGCHGSRLTGAGFGGCTLHLVEPGAEGAVARALAARFGAPCWAVRPADGAASFALA